MRSQVLVILMLIGGLAEAQRAATAPAPEPRREPHPPSGIGGDLVFGWGGQRGGPSGWVARFEYEVLPVFAPRGTVGAVFGFQPGFEYWRSGDDHWGFSLPVAITGGIRVFPIRAIIGIGADAFLVDQVADDTGVGFWAPFAMARLGADLLGFQLGADARIGYRWQFGAEDHSRWQLGIFIGKTWEPPRNRPMY